jgi:hypothetical protein
MECNDDLYGWNTAAVGGTSIKAAEAHVAKRCKEGKMLRALCIIWIFIYTILPTREPSHCKLWKRHAWQVINQA